MPPEYRVVAKHLAHELKQNVSDFRNDKGMAEIIAEGHAAVMDLRNIKSSDEDIEYIAAHGGAACAEAVRRMERINALPKPPDAGSLFVESFIHGLYGNVYAGYALGTDADNKQKAILAEVDPLAAAVEQADAAHLLLPKVAERYSASVADAPGRIRVDFDESWYGWGPYDWCCLYNEGAELEDCTVIVDMKGAAGDVRRNVHYVQKWPSKSWMYARYDPGTDLNGRRVGRMTVVGVNTVNVTVLSPGFSTQVAYLYQGAEKDKDIAERCKKMTIRWRYQPFDKGIIFSDTQRGVKLTLADYPVLGKCRVDVTFKRGNESKGWYWDIDSWQQDEEKTFSTPQGGLSWDPGEMEVVLSFPGTSHTVRWDLKR